jgi:heat shock protein HslJ
MKRILFVLGLCGGLLALAACGAASQQGGGGDLTGAVWGLSELTGEGIVAGSSITAEFTADGKVSGSSGCNQYAGTYTVSGGSIEISSPLASTMMACTEEIMDQESAYLKALGEVKSYTVEGEKLTLNDKKGATLVYDAQSQGLAGTAWDVIGYNNGKQAVVSVMAGTSLTAEFGADGTVSGNSGCNTYNGTYTVTGRQITIGPLVTTRMACADPAGVMEQESQYLAALQTAATYKIEGTGLELRTKDGALAADFAKK